MTLNTDTFFQKILCQNPACQGENDTAVLGWPLTSSLRIQSFFKVQDLWKQHRWMAQKFLDREVPNK